MTYFDHIFITFKQTLDKVNKGLPSVSLVALEYNNDPYAILVSTIISLRTKDSVTLDATRRIMKLAPNINALISLSNEEIEKAIYPTAFYKRKAVNLKEIAKILLEKYEEKVPSSFDELLALPGVGIKTANLTLNLGFNIDALCVDCHVHRIINRLGLVNTKTPEESVLALEKIMPKKYWIPLNELLVSYGQEICTPISPFCSKCSENDRCAKFGVKTSR